VAYSLPVFTLVTASLDAFNPRAFFVFFFGLVYFAFMAAWLNIFLVTGRLRVLTFIAGLTATIGAIDRIARRQTKGAGQPPPHQSRP
jgi:hypothetical protein